MTTSNVLKLLAAEQALSTANTVSNGRVIRIHETGTAKALITHKDSGGNTIGTITIPTGGQLILRKEMTDTLEANTATVVAVSIAAW